MSRPTRLVVLPLVALAVALVLGGLVVGGALLLLRFGGSDADSGAWLVVAGLFLGVAIGVLAWLVGLARAAQRLFPPGRRLGVVTWCAASVFALTVAVGGLTSTFDDDSGPPGWAAAFGWVVVAAATATPSVVFRLWDRRNGDADAPDVGRA